MKKTKEFMISATAAIAFLVLILDAKTALNGAKDAVTLCLQSVIPSLFPFIVLSLLLNRSFIGKEIKLLQPVGKLCGIPEGSESLLISAYLGGYPVGAQSIADAYTAGTLTKETAKRLLTFCNNAGPAFIFGITGCLFSNAMASWWIWGIHIVSSLLIGIILPMHAKKPVIQIHSKRISLPEALEKSLGIMGSICGWIILFRVMIAFSEKWFLWLFPARYATIFTGALELTNGIFALQNLENEGLRFVLCTIILSFGGICVGMQTVSVTKKLGCRSYFMGKILQTCISIPLAGILQRLIFPNNQICNIPLFVYIICFLLIIVLSLIIRQKSSSNTEKVVV